MGVRAPGKQHSVLFSARTGPFVRDGTRCVSIGRARLVGPRRWTAKRAGGIVIAYTKLNLKCNHLRASFPPCRRLAAVNDALHRLPPLCLGRTKNPLRICSLLD